MKSGNLNFLEPSGPLQACNGTALPFLFIIAFAGQYMTEWRIEKNKIIFTLIN
jgi:hypothetical protein